MSSSLSEWQAIALLSRELATVRAPHTQVGIGDDSAVLRVGGERVVWTIDAAVENVHFDRGWLSMEDLGWKATHAAASDVAAMGAEPLAALAQVTIPLAMSAADVRRLGAGQAEAAKALGCPVIGGNISKGEQLEVVTTVLGRVRSREGRAPSGTLDAAVLRRGGARAGDELWLLGEVGLARAGLAALRAGRGRRGAWGRCIDAWRRPRALVREGLALVGRASACLDVSDGLGGDARHLAEASGVAVVFEEGALGDALVPELRRAARALDQDPVEFALQGGEDYALLATGPKAKRPRAAKRIGRIDEGGGVWLERASGESVAVSGGFDHLLDVDPTG